VFGQHGQIFGFADPNQPEQGRRHRDGHALGRGKQALIIQSGRPRPGVAQLGQRRQEQLQRGRVVWLQFGPLATPARPPLVGATRDPAVVQPAGGE